MNMKFEAKVRYEKVCERTGRVKMVTEKYLVEAVNFAEAETRIHKEMETFISGEFSVTNINNVNYAEVIQTEGDRWYKGKVSFVSIDENAGREKMVSHNVLVQANDVKQAYDNIQEAFKDMTVDYTIASVADSNIMDVFFFAMDLEENEEEEAA